MVNLSIFPLVPVGLTPVIVFPPFGKPRSPGREDAVGVIFTEEMDISEAVDEEAVNRILRFGKIQLM